MRPFTKKQQYLIETGKTLTSQLATIVEQALAVGKKKVYESKRHTYIFSGPGAGKTFTVQTTAEKHKVNLIKIQGAASMNAVANQLAYAVYTITKGNIIVWIDDCDSLFVDEESLNVMKGALDEERNVFVWNKNLTNQINILKKSTNPTQQILGEALEYFHTPGGVGVEIPTDRIRFIITSNMDLTTPNGKKLTNKRKMHEAAIRDRVNYKSFLLDSEQSWGWLASIVTSTKVLPITKDQSRDLLEFMYTNWDNLTGVSMRTVKDLTAEMLNNPNDYPDIWNQQFIQ